MNINTQRRVYEYELIDLKEELKGLGEAHAYAELLVNKKIQIVNKEKQLELFNIHSEHLINLEAELNGVIGFDLKQNTRKAITATNEALIAVVRGEI